MNKSAAIVSWLQFLAALVALNLSAATTHYVSQTSTNPTPPYGTWATAATNIQLAVDVAVGGDLVLVSNGVYAGPVVVTSPVLLMSSAYAGQQYTFIDGHGTNRCIWMTNGARLYGFTLTNGFADYGGGIWCSSTNANVTNCVIVGNSASSQGGGAWSGTFGRCTLSRNSAGSGGGAASATVDDCILTNNSSTASGGGVFTCTLNNCLLTGNTANAGGGAFGGTLNNCTLSGNQANSGGGAQSAALNNSIVYFNSAPTGNNANSCTLNFCCTTPLPGAGEGNIDLNPQFLNLAGGDFRLQAGSPCINAGNNALVVDTSDLDLGGGARIVGGTVDMGAYELPSPSTPVIVVQPQSQIVDSGHDVNFGAAASGAAPLFWQWYFNGSIIPGSNGTTLMITGVTTNNAGAYSVVVTNYLGSATSQVAVLTVTNAAPSFTLQPSSQSVPSGNYFTLTAAADGSFPLFWQWQFNGTAIGNATRSNLNLGPMTSGLAGNYTVVASNAFGTVTSAVATVSLAAGAISYVWPNSPSPTAPYSSWATAAHTIQNAADAAGPGYQIIVTNGTYAGGLNISKPLTVVSVNGPQVTVIDAGYAFISCVSLTNGASLSGFTVTHGYGYTGGGISCLSTNAFLTNCVIAGNRAEQVGGGAYGGTLYNCTLTGNIGTNAAGGAYGSTLVNCIISTNLPGAANSCVLFNCRVLGNTQYGGTVFGSTLYNCLLVGNGDTIYNYGSLLSSTAYNCTLVGNISGVSSSSLYNCITYYTGPGGPNFDGSCTLNYCCTTPIPSNGVGNITNAPLFVDISNGDFHLQPSSPCINSGNNAYVTTTTDLGGNPRILSGTVDIGAYEFPGTGSQISYAWLQYYGLPTDGSADFIDSDGDGMNNWQEWFCGTDPTNPASVLKMLAPSRGVSGLNVPWLSVTNRTYFIQRSTNLALQPAFVTVVTNVAGQQGSTTFSDTNATGAGPFFYRVGVKYP